MFSSASLAAQAHDCALLFEHICHSLETAHHSCGTLLPAVCSSQIFPAVLECSSDFLEAVQRCGDEVLQSTKVAASVIEDICMPCGVACSTVGTFGKCKNLEFEDSSGEERDFGTKWKSWSTSSAIYLNIVVDAFMMGALVKSYGVPIAAHLRTWAVGGLLLGFPLSFVVDHVAQKYGFRRAFVLDVFFACVGYWWLVWGINMLAHYPEMSTEVPSLFWVSLVVAVASWSGLTCSAVVLVSLTFLSLIFS
eukprot:TRINITY_DN9451_c0_g2_i1.p1 TRINITY_DN9451_c0_g2~~TRINITY_DN9451_c0_g2_i1.p1  ORF type:complete len:250 (+),score=30.97 TRINITY_DN9451_c0_g2_i1:43-792(+)